jgi:hypothetical protein
LLFSLGRSEFLKVDPELRPYEAEERASSGSLVPSTLRRMARFAFLVLVIVLLGYQWALPGEVPGMPQRSIKPIASSMVGCRPFRLMIPLSVPTSDPSALEPLSPRM